MVSLVSLVVSACFACLAQAFANQGMLGIIAAVNLRFTVVQGIADNHWQGGGVCLCLKALDWLDNVRKIAGMLVSFLPGRQGPLKILKPRTAQADSLQKYMTLHSYDVYLIVLLSSGVALSYNVVHSLMIQHTSAVATTVIGEARCPCDL